jgi:hypothetical protein
MTSHESPGFLHRLCTALGAALKRGLLGRSTHAYRKQFTGSDAYWDRVIAAQVGRSQKQPPQPDPDLCPGSGAAVVRARPGVRDSEVLLK